MMVLVTYDVNTETKEGKSRLRRVARVCEDYGQRVQNSVFECITTPAELVDLKQKLKVIIDMEKDSLRFYHLGSNWQIRVESMGKITSYDPEKDTFIF
ncbi:MAG: CRISPR-associated endonuclease Cas2 [Methanosarcinaceae archaeon]|nr:CRISPR-associated endonuclease Cas2 [Methanosarcinaceae archaeon]